MLRCTSVFDAHTCCGIFDRSFILRICDDRCNFRICTFWLRYTRCATLRCHLLHTLRAMMRLMFIFCAFPHLRCGLHTRCGVCARVIPADATSDQVLRITHAVVCSMHLRLHTRFCALFALTCFTPRLHTHVCVTLHLPLRSHSLRFAAVYTHVSRTRYRCVVAVHLHVLRCRWVHRYVLSHVAVAQHGCRARVCFAIVCIFCVAPALVHAFTFYTRYAVVTLPFSHVCTRLPTFVALPLPGSDVALRTPHTHVCAHTCRFAVARLVYAHAFTRRLLAFTRVCVWLFAVAHAFARALGVARCVCCRVFPRGTRSCLRAFCLPRYVAPIGVYVARCRRYAVRDTRCDPVPVTRLRCRLRFWNVCCRCTRSNVIYLRYALLPHVYGTLRYVYVGVVVRCLRAIFTARTFWCLLRYGVYVCDRLRALRSFVATFCGYCRCIVACRLRAMFYILRTFCSRLFCVSRSILRSVRLRIYVAPRTLRNTRTRVCLRYARSMLRSCLHRTVDALPGTAFTRSHLPFVYVAARHTR